MDVNGLRISYYQVDKGRREKSFSSWWMGKVGGENTMFPSNEELGRIFTGIDPKGELIVKDRHSNCLIILLPVGVSKAMRQKLLSSVAKHVA